MNPNERSDLNGKESEEILRLRAELEAKAKALAGLQEEINQCKGNQYYQAWQKAEAESKALREQICQEREKYLAFADSSQKRKEVLESESKALREELEKTQIFIIPPGGITEYQRCVNESKVLVGQLAIKESELAKEKEYVSETNARFEQLRDRISDRDKIIEAKSEVIARYQFHLDQWDKTPFYSTSEATTIMRALIAKLKHESLLPEAP